MSEQGNTPASSNFARNAVVLVAVLGFSAVGVVRLFGTTVSTKFNRANTAVSNEVDFGGGGGSDDSYSYSPPTRSYAKK